eukprot:CAMPEP_0168244796 /NCGR_PEP_ID=MMETSP0140_2-20121125/24821_1 /TAXON_ID=44445 /ORGANISM="Pseudo-nitzschia australis, Strain 10249 10 AB" /LENGTH=495 /DNA_ID=CAMNT_0008180341 /DNA_START=538 /DNA_END=2026 /DNA_ORIENTATION=+
MLAATERLKHKHQPEEPITIPLSGTRSITKSTEPTERPLFARWAGRRVLPEPRPLFRSLQIHRRSTGSAGGREIHTEGLCRGQHAGALGGGLRAGPEDFGGNRDGNSDDNNNDSNNNDEQPWDCVLGGSWGATLGLAYAQRYPHAMRSLILRGICALRPPEIDWLLSSQGGSAQNLKEAWKNFSDAVNANVNANENAGSSNGRDALHAHYDCLIGTRSTVNGTADNALRMAAARSWMTWEMAATSSASQSNNNDSNTKTTTTTTNLVLVSSPENNQGKWRFETPYGEPPPVACDDDEDTEQIGRSSSSAETVAFQLRQNINTKNTNGEESTKKGPPPTGPRPVRPIDETMPLFLAAYGDNNNNEKNNSNKTAGRFRLPPDYVPAQAMLTCFYSVNDRYAMGNIDLIRNAACSSSNSSNNNLPIKIIGIQGGLDPICPPDTAMDLLKAIQTSNKSSNMELRIPLNSGHSMYDPGILHELIQATDRLADEFLMREQL